MLEAYLHGFPSHHTEATPGNKAKHIKLHPRNRRLEERGARTNLWFLFHVIPSLDPGRIQHCLCTRKLITIGQIRGVAVQHQLPVSHGAIGSGLEFKEAGFFIPLVILLGPDLILRLRLAVISRHDIICCLGIS